jgi:DNA adenine methylase
LQSFLKWAGGKRWLLPRLRYRLPEYRTYFEPFAGSAGLFFELEPRQAVLGDANPELMNCYRRVGDSVAAVLRLLKALRADERTYYRVRDRLYERGDSVERAAYFIYLNKTCWNGLYRVSESGHFNVPIGRRRPGAQIFDEATLRAASRLLRRTEIVCGDFEAIVRSARKNDLVYFDPPYVTTRGRVGFRKYNPIIFQRMDDLRLARAAHRLAARGVNVLATNHADPLVKQLYDGPFFKTELRRNGRIAADSSRRTPLSELLISTFSLDLARRVG